MFRHLSRQIKRHAYDSIPKESCGLVINDRYLPCDNVSPYEDSFEISPEIIRTYGEDIQAVVHSHVDCDPVPSIADMRCQLQWDIPFRVFRVSSKTNKSSDIFWWGTTAEKQPLIGRPYVFNIYDCLTLVLDYYKMERNIIIPDTPRKFGDMKEYIRAMVRIGKDYGFRRVFDHKREDDVIVYKNLHFGIYLGGDRLLHHVRGDSAYDPTRLSHLTSMSSMDIYPHEIWRYAPYSS